MDPEQADVDRHYWSGRLVLLAVAQWVDQAMKLTLKRIHIMPGYTVGEISVDGVKMGYTLEDEVREKEGVPVEKWKVPGKTAIPAGEYLVTITMSARFKRLLPLLADVPGFSGVRIHPGNKSEDTEGCILVGATWGGGDWISNSRGAFNGLYALMYGAFRRGERITLSIG